MLTKETAETIACERCSENGKHVFLEEYGEWDGEDDNGKGWFTYSGFAECLICGHHQKLTEPYRMAE